MDVVVAKSGTTSEIWILSCLRYRSMELMNLLVRLMKKGGNKIVWKKQETAIFIFDILFALLSVILTYRIIQGQDIYYLSHIKLVELIVFPIIVIAVFFYSDLYNYAVFQNRFRYIYRTTKGIVYTFIVYLLWLWIFKPFHGHHTLFPLILFVIFSGLTYFSRVIILPLLTVILPRRDVIIYAPEGEYRDIERWIKNHSVFNIQKIITDEKEIAKYKKGELPVILFTTTSSWDRLFELILSFNGRTQLLLYSPLLVGIDRVDYWAYINQIPLVPFRWSGNTKGYRYIKRLIDIIGAIVALIVFSPFMVLSALAVKFTSKGSVFFTQDRFTKDARIFKVLKFRSMVSSDNYDCHKEFVKDLINGNNCNGNNVYKMTKDSRITRVGNLLRKTSLDEFPQLFNVLKGDLSLVGPRPPIEYEVELYTDWQKERLSVKQGLTGMWQIFGRSQLPFDKSCFLDIYYAENKSVWMDLHLLMLTLPSVVFGKGAY
ncbi:sugar transferase [candidate division WOR-3 bacterium]|nr:sugar transferase [candidate division WOR-3 bacterium]